MIEKYRVDFSYEESGYIYIKAKSKENAMAVVENGLEKYGLEYTESRGANTMNREYEAHRAEEIKNDRN